MLHVTPKQAFVLTVNQVTLELSAITAMRTVHSHVIAGQPSVTAAKNNCMVSTAQSLAWRSTVSIATR